MSRYFKGYSKKDSSHIAIFEVFDEPQSWRWGLGGGKGKTFMVQAQYVDHSGIDNYATVDDCLEQFVMSREISEEEFDFYKDIQILITEIYMNQFTGGFPRDETVTRAARRINRQAGDLCDQLLSDRGRGEVVWMSKKIFENLTGEEQPCLK